MTRAKRALSSPVSDEENNQSFLNNSDYDTSNKENVDNIDESLREYKHKETGSKDSIQGDVVNHEKHNSTNETQLRQDVSIQSKIPLMTPNQYKPVGVEHDPIDIQKDVNFHPPVLDADGASKLRTTRLVLQEIVLTNFKSYAGTQVIGPFNKSFSAIVGPNGSGKSNVIDSLLFVFGFRALKMRQGRLSELIHNSSGHLLEFCQVDVNFCQINIEDENNGSSHRVPESELRISRKAFRNNSSQYYINDKLSNYAEVTDFLRHQGIDLDHKRFLILQGEVESIAQMKAKAEREGDDGLLEYLEDIIGTTKYKELINQNLNEFTVLNEHCLEKENRLNVVENDKDLLEDRKNEALEFLEMEKKLITKKSIQYQLVLLSNRNTLHSRESQLYDLKDHLHKEKASNEKLTSSIQETLISYNKLLDTVQNLNKQIEALSKGYKQSNKQLVTLDEKSKNLDNRLTKLRKQVASLERTISASKSESNNINEASVQYINDLKDLKTNLEAEKKKLNEIRSHLTDKTSEYSKEVERLKSELEPWEEKLKEKDNAMELISSSIEMLENERSSNVKQLLHEKERFHKINNEGKEKETELGKAESKLLHVDSQIEAGESECSRLNESIKQKRAYLEALRQKTHDSLNLFSKQQNKSNVLSSLQRLVKSGRIEGFYGRLGDLGQIDQKYDVAISTVCPGLESLVVETVETAQTCIDYLRKNKLGYANFICLNKLRKFDLSPIELPFNPATVKRVFDLIVPHDKKFLPAFYSKLYNTLVASSLQEAKQVSYGAKRWKVVTLDGTVVDTSGTLSGGGNNHAKGLMRLSSNSLKSGSAEDFSTDDVEQLQAKLTDMEKVLESSRLDLVEKEKNLLTLKDMKPNIEFQISRLKLEIQSLTSERSECQKNCKELALESANNLESDRLKNQIDEMENSRRTLENEKESFKSQMSHLELQISKLEEKILEAGGVELQMQNAKVDSIKQKIEILEEKSSNDKMSLKKLELSMKRNCDVLNEARQEYENTEKEMQRLKEEQEIKRNELNILEKEINQLENQRDGRDAEFETLKSELDERQHEINEFKSREIELENKIEKLTALLTSIRANIEANEYSLKGLAGRDITPYISWIDERERKKYDGAQLNELSEEELKHADMERIDEEIESIEKYMDTVKVDIGVLKEYGDKRNEFFSRKDDLNFAIERRDQIKSYCEELKRKRLDIFMEGFNIISMSLKEMYQMITMGGNAELELVDSLDPFAEGILFSVMPPKKSWRNISNLSGGEKTLSSLALVFALHKFKPTPLYVMDEIDAALDFRNVSIVANYIKDRTKDAQFVVISLRNNMFELAQQLVGIYKVNNMTKSVSIQNRDFLNAK